MWQPINTAPEHEPILVFAPKAHRGHDSCEVVVICKDDANQPTFWTNGGPNGGSDLWFDKDETPTHWMPLPEAP